MSTYSTVYRLLGCTITLKALYFIFLCICGYTLPLKYCFGHHKLFAGFDILKMFIITLLLNLYRILSNSNNFYSNQLIISFDKYTDIMISKIVSVKFIRSMKIRGSKKCCNKIIEVKFNVPHILVPQNVKIP